MTRSIRGTLQVWYGATLVVAVGALVAVMDYQQRRGTLQRIDAELEGAAQTLLAGPDFSEDPAHDVRDPSRPEEQEWARRMGLDYNGTGVFSDVWWKTVPENAMRRLQQAEEKPYYLVWSGSGRVTRASDPGLTPPTDALGLAAVQAAVANIGRPAFIARSGVHEVVVAEAGRYPMRVLVGKSIQPELEALGRYRIGVIGAGGAILLVGLVGGWLLIGRALRPIEEISATARAISGSDLSRRISAGEMKTELAALAGTLNDAFARVDAAFERQRQFTADASHELRTPLAVVNSQAELALGLPRSAEEYRQALEVCHRAGRRLGAMADSLLILARVDARQVEPKPEDFDLRDCVSECLDLLHDLMTERNLKLTTDLASVPARTDRSLLLRVMTNLISNAIHYNRASGEIRVALRAEGKTAVIEVADTGIGIAPEDQARVFQRFFRADMARSASVGGAGLGLSICQSIVACLGGTISFTSKPGVGTTFVVRLPLEPAAPVPGDTGGLGG